MDKKYLKSESNAPKNQSIPGFLLKLRTLLDDESSQEWICWDKTGLSFHLYKPSDFSKVILPLYFKHSNLASFVRQLNMYGFKKVASIETGALHSPDEMEFQNSNFVKDQPELIANIRRKGAVVRDRISDYCDTSQAVVLPNVLTDISELKDSQKDVNDQLNIIKRENALLWRELADLRRKHSQQQHIINKLFKFLVNVAGPGQKQAIKRPNNQLMIVRGPAPAKRLSTEDQLSQNIAMNIMGLSPNCDGNNSSHLSVTDVTDELRDVSSPGVTRVQKPAVDTKLPDSVEQVVDSLLSQPLRAPESQSQSNNSDAPSSNPSGHVTDTAPCATMSPASNCPSFPAHTLCNPADGLCATQEQCHTFSNNFSNGLDEMQSDLDVLRDLFSRETLGLQDHDITHMFDEATGHSPDLYDANSPTIDLDELMASGDNLLQPTDPGPTADATNNATPKANDGAGVQHYKPLVPNNDLD